jgi:hypothetical protein
MQLKNSSVVISRVGELETSMPKVVWGHDDPAGTPKGVVAAVNARPGPDSVWAVPTGDQLAAEANDGTNAHTANITPKSRTPF